MANDTRNFSHVKRLIVKVGTSSLTYENGRLNLQQMERLAWVLTDLRNKGLEVVLVSSGAIAVGAARMEMAQRPRDIVGKQAASAVGQAVLMQIYLGFFMAYNQKMAQILLTKDVLDEPVRKNHAKNTFEALLGYGVIPIVNENDTVAVDELGFSENDMLSAYVACLVEGDLLVMLSDIDGLYETDPRVCENPQLIPTVETITPEIESLGGSAGSARGTGGMAAKIAAAKLANAAGIHTIIASGKDPGILFDIMAGKPVGTLFCRNV